MSFWLLKDGHLLYRQIDPLVEPSCLKLGQGPPPKNKFETKHEGNPNKGGHLSGANAEDSPLFSDVVTHVPATSLCGRQCSLLGSAVLFAMSGPSPLGVSWKCSSATSGPIFLVPEGPHM